MLMGKSPYDDANEKDILQMIEKQPLSFVGPRWQCITKETKSVLKSMLERDPRKRMTVTEILDHPWLNKAYDFVAKNCEKFISTDEAKVEVIQNFINFLKKKRVAKEFYNMHVNLISSEEQYKPL